MTDEPARPAEKTETQQKRGTPASKTEIFLMGWGMIALSLLLVYLLLVFFPSEMNNESKGGAGQMIHLIRGYWSFEITLDARLFMTVMVAGGLGSFIHAATSFGDYVGNEKLTVNWIWWYILRLFIGMTLGVVFYLVIRGGFLSVGTNAGNMNPFGIAALASLAGMFSKQATDKLNEVFNTLFTTQGDANRKDGLTNPLPVITGIEPQSVEPKTKNLLVTVKGTGFVSKAVVRVNDISRDTTFNGPTQLTTKLLPEDVDVEQEGELELTVFNPGPGGGTSTPIKLKIAPKS